MPPTTPQRPTRGPCDCTVISPPACWSPAKATATPATSPKAPATPETPSTTTYSPAAHHRRTPSMPTDPALARLVPLRVLMIGEGACFDGQATMEISVVVGEVPTGLVAMT